MDYMRSSESLKHKAHFLRASKRNTLVESHTNPEHEPPLEKENPIQKKSNINNSSGTDEPSNLYHNPISEASEL